jgi:WD40 repeat protein
VVTGGEFGWEERDVSGDAAPEALQGVFSEEPRWVDLRFARAEEQLDLKHPAFNSAIADIASTIRGVPKDELASEEVRQHRRTVRTAWAAGISLLALAIVATGAAVFAFSQQAEANRQRDAARTAEERALEGERLAQENEQRALTGEAEARRQADTREAERLAALASGGETSRETALLLLLQALAVAPPQSVEVQLNAELRNAMLANPLLERFEAPRGRNSVALSPDGRTIYHASPSDGSVRAIDVASGDVEWERVLQPGGFPDDDLFGPPRFQIVLSPDGETLAVVVAPGDVPVRVVVLDIAGNVELEFSPGACPVAWIQGDGFSADGEYFSISTGSERCGAESPDEDWAMWYDSESWEVVDQLQVFRGVNERVLLPHGGEALLVTFNDPEDGDSIELRSVASGELVGRFEGGYPALSPVGDLFFYDEDQYGVGGSYDIGFYGRSLDLARVDLVTLDRSALELPRNQASRDNEVALGNISLYRFAADGTKVAVLLDRSAVVMTSGAAHLTELRFEQDAYDLAWSADGSRLVTSHEEVLIVWAIEPDRDRTAEINRADDWPSLALELLGRSFTEAECGKYRIDPCPSLEDLERSLG